MEDEAAEEVEAQVAYTPHPLFLFAPYWPNINFRQELTKELLTKDKDSGDSALSAQASCL